MRQRETFFTGRHGVAGSEDASLFGGQWYHVAQFHARRPGLFFVAGIQSWSRVSPTRLFYYVAENRHDKSDP